MAKTKMALDRELREGILAELTKTLKINHDTDVMPVSASEIVMPVVDAEGNETFALIKVSIPHGTRTNGGFEAYDGYAAADSYRLDVEDKLAKKQASEAKKKADEARKERKRNARKVVKELNEKGLDKMIHEDEEKDDPNQFLPNEVAW